MTNSSTVTEVSRRLSTFLSLNVIVLGCKWETAKSSVPKSLQVVWHQKGYDDNCQWWIHFCFLLLAISHLQGLLRHIGIGRVERHDSSRLKVRWKGVTLHRCACTINSRRTFFTTGKLRRASFVSKSVFYIHMFHSENITC